MTDYSELKRLAKAAMYACWHKDDLGDALEVAPLDDEVQAFILSASPAVVFELIAKNDRIESEAVYSAAGFSAAREEIARLKSENERLDRESQNLSDQLGACDRERRQFKADNEALRKAANELRRFATCEHMHHDKPEWHEYDEPCKVLARIDVILGHGDKSGG